MKSTISYAKLFRSLWKQQAWVQMAALLAAFVSGPVAMLIGVNQWKRAGLTIHELRRRFLLEIGGYRYSRTIPFMGIYCIAMMAIGVIAGWYLFSYLHAREKTDFFHALAVPRARMFWLHTLCAATNYIAAGTIAMILLLLSGSVLHITIMETVRAAAGVWITGFVFYMLSFAIAALSMLLTGRILVGLLGTGIFFSIGPMISLLIKGYSSIFFDTWQSVASRRQLLPVLSLSPVVPALRAVSQLNSGSGWKWVFAAAAAAAAFLLLNTLLCRRRPSEAAGRAMAFYAVGEVIQIVLSSVAALMCGLFILMVMNRYENIWFLFALLFGLAVFYAIIRMIYYTNLKKMFSGKWQLAASLALTLSFAAFFRFDLAGYDRYLPPQEEIESIGLSMDEDRTQYFGGVWMDARQNSMVLACDDDVYALLKALCENQLTRETVIQGNVTAYTKNVLFRLKNGKSVRRSYLVDFAAVQDYVKKLYDKPEYTSLLYLMNRIDASKFSNIAFSCVLPTDDDYLLAQETPLQGEQGTELIRALQQDSARINAQTVTNEQPVGVLFFSIPSSVLQTELQFHLPEAAYRSGSEWEDHFDPEQSAQEGYDGFGSVPVYPSFRRTVELMQRFASESETAYRSGDIHRIKVYRRSSEDAPECITSPERIRELLPEISFASFRSIWQEAARTKTGDPVSVVVQGSHSQKPSGGRMEWTDADMTLKLTGWLWVPESAVS